MPDDVKFFDDKNIIDISCGRSHSLALSSEGIVYGWGRNKSIPYSDSDEEFEFEFSSNFGIDLRRTISVKAHSAAKKDNVLRPIVLRIFSETIKSIYCSEWNSYVQTSKGEIICLTNIIDSHLKNIDEIIFDFFDDWQNDKWYQTNKFVYERRNSFPFKTNYKNRFEFFLLTNQTTCKTIHLENNQIFSIDLCLTEGLNQITKSIKAMDFNELKQKIYK